jgi:hypothetical protein
MAKKNFAGERPLNCRFSPRDASAGRISMVFQKSLTDFLLRARRCIRDGAIGEPTLARRKGNIRRGRLIAPMPSVGAPHRAPEAEVAWLPGIFLARGDTSLAQQRQAAYWGLSLA